MAEIALGTDGSPWIEADAAMLSMPSRLEAVAKMADFLRFRAESCGACDNDRGGKLLIALHEALTNAVVHGNLGISSSLKEQSTDAFAKTLAERSADPVLSERRVRVHFHFDGSICQISIADEGEGFDFQKWIEECEKQADTDQPCLNCSGRGIMLMRALLDEVQYRHGGREVVLTLRASDRLERRRDERISCCEPLRVVPVRADGSIAWESADEAVVRNVSQGGMGLVQNGEHSPSRVLLELHDGNRPVYLPADVCHVVALQGGLFQIGCRFSSETPEDAAAAAATGKVDQIIDQLAGPPARRRRAHRRVPYSVPVQIRQGEAEEPRTAFSRDLSRGGIALICSFELPRGAVELSLRGPDGTTQTFHAYVVRCQRVTAGIYDIGCQFS